MNATIGVLLLSGMLGVADSGTSEPGKSSKPPASAETPKKLTQAELEEKFRETLAEAVFQGTWQMTTDEGLKGKAALSEPRTDKYTISKATKIAGDRWLIMARVQYGDKDVTIPIPVRVVWAGDTPIITLDDINMPGLGTYSARVMVYRNFYSGTWFGDCYGGILSGQIVRSADADAIAPKTAGDDREADRATADRD